MVGVRRERDAGILLIGWQAQRDRERCRWSKERISKNFDQYRFILIFISQWHIKLTETISVSISFRKIWPIRNRPFRKISQHPELNKLFIYWKECLAIVKHFIVVFKLYKEFSTIFHWKDDSWCVKTIHGKIWFVENLFLFKPTLPGPRIARYNTSVQYPMLPA